MSCVTAAYKSPIPILSVLSTKSIHDRDLDLFQDSNAIAQEFYEWVNPEINDQEVISLEYIGEGSKYD